MDPLRLGVVGLSSAEKALVATFFRLHRFEPSFIWTLGEAPPYDALLVDADCGADAFEHLLGRGTLVKRLTASGSEQPGEMPRPIRSDVLLQWLHSIEPDLLHGSREDFPPTVTEEEPALEPEPAYRVTPSTDAPVASAAVPISESDPVPVFAAFAAGTLFKLRRWPSHELLAGDMSRIRIATMLSRRQLSLQQLVEATGVAANPCKAFIGSLDQAGLISTEQPAPSQSDPAQLAQALNHEAGFAPQTRGIGPSLLRGIRKRFGL